MAAPARAIAAPLAAAIHRPTVPSSAVRADRTPPEVPAASTLPMLASSLRISWVPTASRKYRPQSSHVQQVTYPTCVGVAGRPFTFTSAVWFLLSTAP